MDGATEPQGRPHERVFATVPLSTPIRSLQMVGDDAS